MSNVDRAVLAVFGAVLLGLSGWTLAKAADNGERLARVEATVDGLKGGK